MKYLRRFLAGLLGMWGFCQIFPSYAGYSNIAFLLLAAAILALLYTFIRPVLQLLGSPITLLTCGLFIFVINAGLIKLTAALVGGLWLHGFWLCIGLAFAIGVLDRIMACFMGAAKVVS